MSLWVVTSVNPWGQRTPVIASCGAALAFPRREDARVALRGCRREDVHRLLDTQLKVVRYATSAASTQRQSKEQT